MDLLLSGAKIIDGTGRVHERGYVCLPPSLARFLAK